MKIKELASYCELIEINCFHCAHQLECIRLTAELDEVSPVGVVKLVEDNIELSE